MQVKSDNVTYPEYQYLQKQLVLLPDIPAKADSIQINYYHDGFLPDFLLNINFRIPANEPQQIDGVHWLEKRKDDKYKYIEFTDGES